MRTWRAEHGSSLTGFVLLLPTLALTLGLILHVGLYLLCRQTVVTAVAQGLHEATLYDRDLHHGRAVILQILADRSPTRPRTVTLTETDTTVTISATVDTPAVIPGLPRTIVIEQTGIKEQWVAP